MGLGNNRGLDVGEWRVNEISYPHTSRLRCDLCGQPLAAEGAV